MSKLKAKTLKVLRYSKDIGFSHLADHIAKTCLKYRKLMF